MAGQESIEPGMSELDRLFMDYGATLWLLLAAAVLVILYLHVRLQARVARMQLHYQRLVRNSSGANLEEILDHHLEAVEQTTEQVAELEHLCHEIEGTLRQAIQRVGLVRFNPFSDTGGDQSFSIALLDGRNDGLVISSLFSRTETRVFAKPIHAGQSKYNLTVEEVEAIQLAGGASPTAQIR